MRFFRCRIGYHTAFFALQPASVTGDIPRSPDVGLWFSNLIWLGRLLVGETQTSLFDNCFSKSDTANGCTKNRKVSLQEMRSQRLTLSSFAVTGRKPLPCTGQKKANMGMKLIDGKGSEKGANNVNDQLASTCDIY